MKKGDNKRKYGKLIQIMGAFDAYLAMLVLLVVFALFCSGRVGWFLLIVALGAPIISVVWTYIASRFIHISIKTDDRLLEIGEIGEMQVTIGIRSILPASRITFLPNADKRVNIDKSRYRITPNWFSESKHKVIFTARYAGLSRLTIERAYVSDFLGLVRINVLKEPLEPIEIGILPAVTDLYKEEEWLLEARSAAFDGEEPEESMEDTSHIFGGFPGYDHREYVAGDPIKRINYKLSARLGSLQVRLDEKQAVAGISMALLSSLPEFIDEGEEKTVAIEGACLQDFYAIAKHLYMKEFAVKILLPGDEVFEIYSGDVLETLRKKLAYISFEKLFTPELAGVSGTLIGAMAFGEQGAIELLRQYSKVEGNNVSLYIADTGEGRRL